MDVCMSHISLVHIPHQWHRYVFWHPGQVIWQWTPLTEIMNFKINTIIYWISLYLAKQLKMCRVQRSDFLFQIFISLLILLPLGLEARSSHTTLPPRLHLSPAQLSLLVLILVSLSAIQVSVFSTVTFMERPLTCKVHWFAPFSLLLSEKAHFLYKAFPIQKYHGSDGHLDIQVGTQTSWSQYHQSQAPSWWSWTHIQEMCTTVHKNYR